MNHKKILQAMKAKKVSGKQLSERSNVPIGTLNKILYGITKDPSVNTVQNIAYALDCPLEDFLDRTEGQALHLRNDCLDPLTSRKVQEIYEDPNTRILLDAKRELAKEDLHAVLRIIQSLKAKEGN